MSRKITSKGFISLKLNPEAEGSAAYVLLCNTIASVLSEQGRKYIIYKRGGDSV